jgi:hypothetical protein
VGDFSKESLLFPQIQDSCIAGPPVEHRVVIVLCRPLGTIDPWTFCNGYSLHKGWESGKG